MVLWEFMGASRVTLFPPIIVIAFACSFTFNTGTPFGVLLIRGDFFND